MPGRGWRRSWFDEVVASVLAFRCCRRWRGCGPASAGGRLRRRNTRLQWRLRRQLGRLGQLHRPRRLLAGIDLEEPGAVEAARKAIRGALDGELFLACAHEGLARPFAAVIIVDRIDIIKTRDKNSAQQGLAGARREIPPALGGPALVLLVADRDADPTARIVAESKIRGRRIRHHSKQQREEVAG